MESTSSQLSGVILKQDPGDNQFVDYKVQKKAKHGYENVSYYWI